jgi:hypothetical protein
VVGAAKDGHVDVVTSIARVLPTLVIGSLLGKPSRPGRTR